MGGVVDGHKIIGNRCVLFLGAKLFNKMMDNYTDSLLRKRRYFVTPKERSKKAAESTKNSDGISIKLNISKNELKNLIWIMPSTEIAKKFGVSDRLITKKCRQWGIEKPQRGYWAKKRSKKNLNS